VGKMKTRRSMKQRQKLSHNSATEPRVAIKLLPKQIAGPGATAWKELTKTQIGEGVWTEASSQKSTGISGSEEKLHV